MKNFTMPLISPLYILIFHLYMPKPIVESKKMNFELNFSKCEKAEKAKEIIQQISVSQFGFSPYSWEIRGRSVVKTLIYFH